MSQTAMTKADKKAKKNEARDTIVVIIEALLIALVFRTFIYQPFSIPTASMQSTMMIGDYFVADKCDLGLGPVFVPDRVPFNGRILAIGEPQRGDIAVFHNEPTNEDYIKRIIGMPGDHIQMKDGRLYINGKKVDASRSAPEPTSTATKRPSRSIIYKETLPNGVVHTIQEISDSEPLDNTAEYVVPAGPLLHDGRQPRPLRRQPRAVPGRLRAGRATSSARLKPVLLDQGQYSAVAALAVAGERPLGPHAAVGLSELHHHSEIRIAMAPWQVEMPFLWRRS